MPIDQESFNTNLYKLLKTRGYKPVPKDAKNQRTDPNNAEVFNFTFTKDGKEYGDAWVTIDDASNVVLYYSNEQEESPSGKSPGLDYDDSWSGLKRHLKQWSMNKQLTFELRNKDELGDDMAQRDYVKKKEKMNETKEERSLWDPSHCPTCDTRLRKVLGSSNAQCDKCMKIVKVKLKKHPKQMAEGYHPMGKKASYNDNIPAVKIILQHNRQIEEGEQRYRNIAKIFLENQDGERFLAPTTRPGIAQVYARHIAEGGVPNDERWNHIKTLCEEYSKMAGFVRATKNKQFNESAQQLVSEGINHYQSLRETLGKLRGHRGYNQYFESWTPALMEDDTDMTTINELFVQETLDPRIESVMPILAKFHKKDTTVKEVAELAEWADKIAEGDCELEEGLVRDEFDDFLDSMDDDEMYDYANSDVPKNLRGKKDPTDKELGIKLRPGALKDLDEGECEVEEGVYDRNSGQYVPRDGRVFSQHNHPRVETCELCGDETGKAGPGEGSIYDDEGFGPYCENCREEHPDKFSDINEGLDNQKIYQVAIIGNFWGGKYYESSIDSIFVLADSPEEAKEIAEANIDAVKGHFMNKRYRHGDGVKSALRRMNPGPIKIGNGSPKPTSMTKYNKTLTSSGKFEPVSITSQSAMAEGLDKNQKKAGQLGPTEKIGKKGAVGKLVGVSESVSDSSNEVISDLINGNLDAYDVMNHPRTPAQQKVAGIMQQMYDDITTDNSLHGDDDFEEILSKVVDRLEDQYGNNLNETSDYFTRGVERAWARGEPLETVMKKHGREAVPIWKKLEHESNLKEVCSDCAGHGEDEEGLVCGSCEGTGEVESSREDDLEYIKRLLR